jgi:hypothetical protein
MELKEPLDFWIEVKVIIETIADKFDKTWLKRKRILSTQLLVTILFKLVLSKNRQGYGSNLLQFWETCAEKGITLPQINSIAASSFCEARQKLPEAIFEQLNQALIVHWQKTQVLPVWKNHRLFAIDGSRINLPRDLINAGYKLYDKQRRHYPQGLLSCLYNLQEKIEYDFSLATHMDERSCALEHIKQLTSTDIIVFDRGYFSYLLLYKVIEQGIHVIFRLQPGTVNKKVLEFWESDQEDILIDSVPSPAVVSDLKKRGFYLVIKPLPLRLIKHKINDELYVYGTTLIGNDYPKDCFAEVYHGRWGIEELYKISKNFIEVEDFHAQTERGVKQELYTHLLLINLARFFELEAQKQLQSPSNKKEHASENKNYFDNIFYSATQLAINFKNCLLVTGRYLENLLLASKALIGNWLSKVIGSIVRLRQRKRPNRHYPRISHKPRRKWESFRNVLAAKA